jgi:hypothetical protein
MRLFKVSSPQITGPIAVLGLAVLVSGCGSSSSSSASAASSTAAAVSTTSTTKSAPKLHLSILSPKAGAHTGSVVAVRVKLPGGRTSGADPLRYTLDGRDARVGSRRLVFHDVRSGRHHLVVMLAANPLVRDSTVFVVRTPPPPPPAPVVSTPAPAPAPAPAAAPAPMPAPPVAGNGGIPQGNGGDGDGDNRGAASDGDGNI